MILNRLFNALLVVIFLLYPLAVYFGLAYFGVTPVAILLSVLALLRMWFSRRTAMWPLALLALICGVLSLLLNNEHWLKLYPVAMNIGALFIFAMTLIKPPSFIERIARMMEPDLPESGVRWTRQVTQVWCLFFIINGSIAFYTAQFASLAVWTLYNGLISYLLMGCLLLGEYLLRGIVRKNAQH